MSREIDNTEQNNVAMVQNVLHQYYMRWLKDTPLALNIQFNNNLLPLQPNIISYIYIYKLLFIMLAAAKQVC